MQNQNYNPKTDLKVRSYKFSVDLVKFLRKLPRDFFNAPFVNQLMRCGTSVGANITEARGANSKKDFAKFYDIALKSALETVYWLDLFSDALEIKSEEIAILRNEAGELGRMLGASLLTMRNKR